MRASEIAIGFGSARVCKLASRHSRFDFLCLLCIDIACPWCLVGKKRLDKAIEQFDGQVRVHWRAFELNPAAERESPPNVDYVGKVRCSKVLATHWNIVPIRSPVLHDSSPQSITFQTLKQRALLIEWLKRDVKTASTWISQRFAPVTHSMHTE